MKLRNFSKYLSTVNFSEFSTFSKFVSIYEESNCGDVIILNEILSAIKDRSVNSSDNPIVDLVIYHYKF